MPVNAGGCLCLQMNTQISSLSPGLLKANQRLHELRQLAQLNRTETEPSGQMPPWEESADEDSSSTVTNVVSQLPPHLGWGSESISQAIRTALRQHKPEHAPVQDEQLRADYPFFRSISDGSYSGGQPLGVYDKARPGSQLRLPLDGDTVKHYPSIGIAALKEEQAAIYRVWLMCRYLDVDGRGWLPVQDVRKQLTGKESKLRLYCWRRLRQILGQGHDRFWQWDKTQSRL